MLWKGRRESGNVLDKRGVGVGGMSLGGLVIGAIAYYLMGGNPLVYVANNLGSVETGGSQSAESQARATSENAELKSFVSVVLADTEDVWREEFRKAGHTYEEPRLVLFKRRVESACGRASAASGPFYCPSDRQLYLDFSFFDELSNRLGANGDFAAAYVIAHEVGHHVQTLMGLSPSRDNRASVQFELQADCFAGVWAKNTESKTGAIEPGDIDEAMRAAAAVGDDRLQKMSGQEVMPDSFTHGSSAQRQDAFRRGYAGGSLGTCVSAAR